MSRLLVGDSMVKHIKYLNDTDIVSFRGAKVEDLSKMLKNEAWKMQLMQYSTVLLFVGTNNIEGDLSKEHMCKYKELVSSLKALNPTWSIVLSSILPRPRDDEVNGYKVILMNYLLKKHSSSWGATFIPSYKLFMYKGHISKEYYCMQHYDRIHLNNSGVLRIRQYVQQKLSECGNRPNHLVHGSTTSYFRSEWSQWL